MSDDGFGSEARDAVEGSGAERELEELSRAAARDLGFPVDYSGIDLRVAAEVDGHLRHMASRHPVVCEAIVAVRTSDRMVPLMPMGYNQHGIALNRRQLSQSAEAVAAQLRAAVLTGVHPPGCDSVSAGISHEIGEALETFIDLGGAGILARAALAEWRCHTPYIGLGGYVRYRWLVHGEDERFAEVLMAVLHTPRRAAGPVLQTAVGRIETVLREVKGW